MDKAQSFNSTHADEVKKVNIADLQDRNGKQPSYRWFNGRVQKAKDVYAITSFGRFLLAVRQPSPSQEWLESSGCQNINNIINTVCLDQFSGDVSGNDYEPSPKRIRMERQLRLLQQQQQQK